MVRRAAVVTCLPIVLVFSGCFLWQTSPAQYGIDLRVAPGFAVGDGGTTIHPTVAYARPLFGGVDGETDNVIHLGLQTRFPLASSDSGWWVGGEATVGRRWTSYDLGALPSDAGNGFALAAIVGRPVTEIGLGVVHMYAAAGLLKWGGTGPYVRVGIDLQPSFLNR